MRVERIATCRELAALATEWNCLTGGIPFRRHEWLATWWKYYGGDVAGASLSVDDDQPTTLAARRRQLFVLTARTDAGALVGIAPWYVDRKNVAEGRVLRNLGSGEACSDYLGVLATAEFESSAIDAIADYLCDPASADWDAIELEGIDAEEPTIRRLCTAVALRDAIVVTRPGLNCWRLTLPESWDAYLASVSKSHRKQLRRIETRLLDNGRAVLCSARTPNDATLTWPTLIDLHQRRRTALGEPGCFASPRFDAFHSEVVQRFAELGMLRLDVLSIDGTPVAAEYHLSGGGVSFAYQAGVAPEAMDDEPGRAITVALIRRAITDGLSAIDFLRGDEPYKAHFRAEPRPSIVTRIVAPRAAARWRHRAWVAGSALKGAVKRGLGWKAPIGKSAKAHA